MGRYAEGTTVAVEKSVEDLRRLATRYGADEFTYAMSPHGGVVMFKLQGYPLRYDVTFPTDEDTVKRAEAEWRRRWRVVLLRAKGQFEAIEDGDTSVPQAFMAQLMMEDGTTLGTRVDRFGVEGLAEVVGLPMLGAGS